MRVFEELLRLLDHKWIYARAIIYRVKSFRPTKLYNFECRGTYKFYVTQKPITLPICIRTTYEDVGLSGNEGKAPLIHNLCTICSYGASFLHTGRFTLGEMYFRGQ